MASLLGSECSFGSQTAGGVVSGGKSFAERLLRADDSGGKSLLLSIPWSSFIHREKSSSCQLIPDSSKVGKSPNVLSRFAQNTGNRDV
jgi:hypothetical protein